MRGVAVFYAEDGAMHGTIENLSSSGALVTVAGVPSDQNLDVELKLGEDSGWVSARTVRIERTARRWRIAVQFDRVDAHMRAAIEGAIDHALRAAQRRPILVIDDRARASRESRDATRSARHDTTRSAHAARSDRSAHAHTAARQRLLARAELWAKGR